MNAADRKEFDLIHNKIADIKKDIDELKNSMNTAHQKTDENLRFIKESLFNPHEGLWAETKLNTQYRQEAKKWRYGVGILVIGAWFKNIWEMF